MKKRTKKSVPLNDRTVEQLVADIRSNLVAVDILAITLAERHKCSVYISTKDFNESLSKAKFDDDGGLTIEVKPIELTVSQTKFF